MNKISFKLPNGALCSFTDGGPWVASDSEISDALDLMMADWLDLNPGYHPYPALEFSHWLAGLQDLTDVEITGFDEFQAGVQY